MDSLSAIAMGMANRNKRIMVFDWNKAATLIRELKPKNVAAGLRSDWEWTSGEIYSDNKPNLESYTYLASTWAKPEIEIDGDIQECWIYQDKSDNWDAQTKWPPSALDILNK